MSDRIEAESLDVFGEEVDAAVDTPFVVIKGPKGDPGAAGKDGHSPVVTATSPARQRQSARTGRPLPRSRMAQMVRREKTALTGKMVRLVLKARTASRRRSDQTETGISARPTPASRHAERLDRKAHPERTA